MDRDPEGATGEHHAARPAEAHAHWAWPARKGMRAVNIALQGGGAHGAFTWGVLDRLLEEDRLVIEAISGTSAGAVNAVVLAEGLHRGGPAEARRRLEEFWKAVSIGGNASELQQSMLDVLLSNWNLENNPFLAMFEMMSRVVSPYQFNPLNLNPLKELLEASVDFDAVRACQCIELFVSATNVHTGRVRVFTTEEMTADAVMASACLPFLFQAVEIDGEHYWDGGYMGNPAIFPIIYSSASKDVVLVHVNPIERPQLPVTASDIFNRINDISFNSSLMREIRAIAFVTRLIDAGHLDASTYSRMRIHAVRNDADMARLGVASKFSPDWDFLAGLRDAGRAEAAKWLEGTFDLIGEQSSIDVDDTYL